MSTQKPTRMTGPEHYREAEMLIHVAANMFTADEADSRRSDMLARAQVHATLAVAAATMDAVIDTSTYADDAWGEVTTR